MRAVLVADNEDRDAGLLGDYVRRAGGTIRYLDRRRINATSVSADVLILLGSNRSAHDDREAAVVGAEVDLIRRTLSTRTPVMGICYGAQVLARALGGSSLRSPKPERGWTEVFSHDHPLCPPGFWAQMHHDVIVPAETSAVIGWSPVGPQAFIDESLGARAIGWQFHPELLSSTLERWLRRGYSGSEGADPGVVLSEATRHALDSIPRAFELFGAAFRYLEIERYELGRD